MELNPDTVSLLLKLLTLSVGLITLLSLVLMLSSLRKSKELIKARLFLHYDRLNKLFIYGSLAIVLSIIFHLAFVMLDPEAGKLFNLETGAFIPYGIYLLAVYIGASYLCMTVYKVLRSAR